MNITNLIGCTVEGFSRTTSQARKAIGNAMATMAGRNNREELAHAKRRLEKALRDSGMSRAESKRIAGATMRQTELTHKDLKNEL